MEKLTFEQQVEILFSRPKKTKTAQEYLREQRRAKRENKTIQNVVKSSYLF